MKFLGTKISIFQRGIKIFGPNFSHLIFEAVNFLGFWDPAEMRENDFEENKVVPLIFKQFSSRSHLMKLDRLTPQDVSRSVNFESKFSSQNFFQKTNQRICFSILTTYQDRKTNSMVRFLEEVLAGKFVFDFYWPLASERKAAKIQWDFHVSAKIFIFSKHQNLSQRNLSF